jgi:hypothetical protein
MSCHWEQIGSRELGPASESLVNGRRHDPLHDLDVQEAIDLRWTLRDIRAKRWKLSPINPAHLEKLKSMGLVEMRNDDPVLTNAGIDAVP